jgi:anti-sigma factor RsiW
MSAPDPMDHDLLSAYLDGELDDASRAEVDARLAESSEWRAELDEVRGARTMLRAVAPRRAPDGFWETVLAAVEAGVASDASDRVEPAEGDPTADPAAVAPVVEIEEHRAERDGRRGPGRWVATAFAAAAAVALAVILVPQRDTVSPDVAAVVVAHGAQASDHGDPVSTITPVGPLAGIRR